MHRSPPHPAEPRGPDRVIHLVVVPHVRVRHCSSRTRRGGLPASGGADTSTWRSTEAVIRTKSWRPAGALLGLLLVLPAHAATLPPTESAAGLVVSAQHLATEAGVEILRQGGNAVDAAVAVGYAEAVVTPCCGNIGGGGFMIAHLSDGRDIFLNFRETAPAAATRDMYLDPAGQPVH